jgi:hydrogenase/urease accessory protein HupE
MMGSLLKRALFSLLVLCAGHSAAHLLPAQNATLNTIDNAAYVVVSVPVSALRGVDNDGDGKLSLEELQRNNAMIVEQFSARFKVTDGDNKGETVLNWLVPPQTDATETTDDHSTYVILMHRVNFARAIEHPTISTDLFGTGPGESQMTITATRNFAAVGASGVNPAASAPAETVGGLREVAILQSGAGTHQFFRGPWSIFADFISIGCKHILGGVDHLLFLLTILVVGAGWRYWLAVITSFTIAHSITLALSVFNVLRLPSNVIEPCIAVSIVLMGLLNLLALRQSKAPNLLARICIVFACGLLHGFGFASAIGAMAVDTRSRIATLAGFNVGIELGQFLFVGAALLAIATTGKLLTKFRPQGGKADSPGFDVLPSQNKSVDQTIGAQLPRLASGIAIICGTVFFFQRLGVI